MNQMLKRHLFRHFIWNYLIIKWWFHTFPIKLHIPLGRIHVVAKWITVTVLQLATVHTSWERNSQHSRLALTNAVLNWIIVKDYYYLLYYSSGEVVRCSQRHRNYQRKLDWLISSQDQESITVQQNVSKSPYTCTARGTWRWTPDINQAMPIRPQWWTIKRLITTVTQCRRLWGYLLCKRRCLTIRNNHLKAQTLPQSCFRALLRTSDFGEIRSLWEKTLSLIKQETKPINSLMYNTELLPDTFVSEALICCVNSKLTHLSITSKHKKARFNVQQKLSITLEYMVSW